MTRELERHEPPLPIPLDLDGKVPVATRLLDGDSVEGDVADAA